MASPQPSSRESTPRLQVFQALETWSARLLGGWQPGIANWEAKHTVGLHLWQDLEVARELRTRLWELRIPRPDRFEQQLVVERVARRLASAQKDTEFIAGLYLGLKRALRDACRDYLDHAHPTWDAPTIPLLERSIAQHESQIEWAEAFLAEQAATEDARRLVRRWSAHVAEVVEASAIFSGTARELPASPPAYDCPLPFPAARRDRRFKTQLHGFERPDPNDHDSHAVWQFLNYAMEMQAAETLGSVLWETDGMDWEFYHDVGRHCHDECRHSRMGEERLKELGHDLSEFPQFTGNYAWRQLCDPLRRYGILTYVIEQDSFALKHESYKTYIQQGDTRSAEAILYDIIDETMHVRWGVKWIPKLIEARGEEITVDALIEECRRAVTENSLSPAQRASRGS